MAEQLAELPGVHVLQMAEQPDRATEEQPDDDNLRLPRNPMGAPDVGIDDSAGQTTELLRVPRDPRQIDEERERAGDLDAPDETPALEFEFTSMEAAQSARLLIEAGKRGDVGAMDAEVEMARRIHGDEQAWQQAREAAVHLLIQTQREQQIAAAAGTADLTNRFDLGGLADSITVPALRMLEEHGEGSGDATAAAAADDADRLPPAVRPPPAEPALSHSQKQAARPVAIPEGAIAVGVSLEDQMALATEYLRSGKQHSADDRFEDAIAAFGAGRWQLKAYFLEPEPEPEPESRAGAQAAAVEPMGDMELDRRASMTEHLWVALHCGLAAVYVRTGALAGAVYCTEGVLCCEPSHLEAMFLRGMAKADMCDWTGASEDLANAHTLTMALDSAADASKVSGAERWNSRDSRQQLAMQLDAKRRECDHKIHNVVTRPDGSVITAPDTPFDR